jgi:ABC-type sugar transport system substrate-binding protein
MEKKAYNVNIERRKVEMFKKLLFPGFLILALLVAGCQPAATETAAPVEEPAATEPPAEEPTATEVPEKPFFGYVMHNFESEFTVEIKTGAEAACKDMNVDCEVTGPVKMDPPQAIQMFEGLLSRNPSGMALVPNPQEPWKPILNQYAEEAKIIAVANGDAPGTPRQLYVGADEVAFGKALGQAVIDAGVTSGKVIIGSCYPPALPLQLRDQGVREVFANYPDIVAETYDSTAEQTTNYAFWENTVTANPDIKAGIGLCTFEGPTFADLMPKLDFDFITVTADLIPETLDAIQKGDVTAAVGQHPFLQGYLPIYFMADFVVNGTPMPEGQVLLPGEIVTIDNLDEVLERQTDPEVAYQWYTAFLKEHLNEFRENAVPFSD